MKEEAQEVGGRHFKARERNRKLAKYVTRITMGT